MNSRGQDDTELGRLMRDFYCKRAEDMCSTVLSERVRELKETQEGVDVMCREMEKIAEAARVSVKQVQEWLTGSVA